MSLAPKLSNCRVNVTYFYKNHEVFYKYFVDEAQTPWEHNSYCICEAYTSYFHAPIQLAEAKQ